MGRAFSHLHEQRFDVVVIGAGINGSSAAQNLAAAGYKCLVVDKGDFASGASGRSSRMLHIGLRYFQAERPVSHFGLHPGRLLNALRMARQAMLAVGELVADSGDRVRPFTMCFPIYRGDPVKRWHVDTGLKLLGFLGRGRVSLDYQMVDRDYPSKIPFFEDFRDVANMQSVACYQEFKFDWPERFCVDMLLNAERNGAVLENYCRARLGEHDADANWVITLHSTRNPDLAGAVVRAPVVLNMAGTWIDDVLPAEKHQGRIVQGTKGAHIVVEMPDTYQGFGVAAMNRLGHPFYLLPLHKNLFSIGVTETLFEGDATDIVSSDEDIDFLIDEANHLLPGRRLSRSDVLKSWAGVRPLTYSAAEPMGLRSRELHDLSERGFPGVFAMTAGPIMTHRSAGRLILETVSKTLDPSRAVGKIDFTPYRFSESENASPFLADEPDVRVSDIERSVTEEHAKSLIDVLLRRTGLGWRRNLSRDEVEQAAEIVAPLLGWSPEAQSAEVTDYMALQEQTFRQPSAGKRDSSQ